MNKILIISILILGAFSCTTTKNLSSDNFYGKQWSLEKITSLSEEQNNSFKQAGLKFSEIDSVYTGSNGCNMISGKFSLNANKISFSEGISTKRYCVGINEGDFHEVLRKTEFLSIFNRQLPISLSIRLI